MNWMHKCQKVISCVVVMLALPTAQAVEEPAVRCGSYDPNSLYAGRAVRFVGLEYRGGTWNADSIATNRAIANLLSGFRKSTVGSTNVHSSGTSCTISNLTELSAVESPAFLYMTGTSGIGISKEGIKTLRDYLIGGGTLFASSGVSQWHRDFTNLVGRIFPAANLFRLPKDEPILSEIPYRLPDGPPSLSSSSAAGSCWGIRHKSRLVVVCYSGDLVGAWDPGNTRLDSQIRESAVRFGINLMNYAYYHRYVRARNGPLKVGAGELPDDVLGGTGTETPGSQH